MKKLLPIALALTLLPSAAHACGVCLDISLSFSAPFIGPVFCVFLAWLVMSGLLRGSLLLSRHASIEIFPSAKGLFRVFVTSLAVFIALWVISAGSFLAPMVPIEVVWLPAIIIRSIDFGARTLPAAPPASRRFCWFFLGMQLCFVALAFAVAPLGYRYSRSVAWLIPNLGSYEGNVQGVVIPGLIARGEESVEPLIEVAKAAFSSPENMEVQRRAAPAVYCLGKIGGPKASAYLASVFKEKVKFSRRDEFRWQSAICFAYARSAGARAALDLIPLYRAMKSGGYASDDAWVILAALAMTRSRPGAQFVLANLDDLLATDEIQGESAALAGAVVAAFLAMGPPEDLRNLPTARLSNIRGYYNETLAPAYFYDACLRRYGSLNYRKLWDKHKSEVRRYWMKTLP